MSNLIKAIVSLKRSSVHRRIWHRTISRLIRLSTTTKIDNKAVKVMRDWTISVASNPTQSNFTKSERANLVAQKLRLLTNYIIT